MQSSLLLTKLKVPPPARHLLRRDRLVDALENGVTGARLALVLAPAGYGKTTLLAGWANQTNLPVAWLTVDPDDNDPERFLRYLFTAWETCQPEIRDAPPGLLLSGMMPDPSAVLAALVNHASDTAAEMALVIDDCHLIENADVVAALTYLVDHLPPSMHLVLVGRGAPSLPVARYRARQEILELGASELEFTPDESGTFLHDTIGLDISDQQLASLNSQLEGWAAGLQLAALALRRDMSIPDLTISGRHRFIADFLRDEVLAHLPDETRRFLLQTCIAERLCGSLVDAITVSANGQAMLEQMERDHLFTMPLDDNREWYRYHRLLLDYLREQIKSEPPVDEVAELHRRAGAWYLDHDMPEPAFDHALAANDIRLVVEVVDTFMQVKMFSGQVTILLQWLRSIPDEWFGREPLFFLFRSVVNVVTGQFDACVRCLDDLELAIGSTEKEMPDVMARVTAMRCFVACFRNDLAQAESFAEVALDTLAPADERYRYGVYGALGDTYRRNGHWTQANEHYLLALEHADNPEGYIQSVHAFGALADLELRQGKLREAAGYWRKALAVINDRRMWGAYPLPLIGWVHIRLGEILYELNDLDAASDHITQGRERAELGGDPRAIIAGGTIAARTMLAQGDIAAAEETLEKVRPTVESAQFPEWSGQFDRCWLRLLLVQDKLRTAVEWSDTFLAGDASAPEPEHENTELAVAHILLLKGDAVSSDRALSLLDDLVESADAAGRTGIQIEALALQSLARWARNDRTSAMTSLEHALRLAEPEGYARTFIDLGLPMARILQETRARNVMPDYVDTLLSGFGQISLDGQETSRLPEPLSEREVEVLRNIAAGLTNREIAGLLFISPETVKKHTGSIYGKLGVRSRMEAVTIARDLDLLD